MAPQHTILVCAMSSTPGQAGGPGDQAEVTLPQDMGGALAGDFKAGGGHEQSQALRGVWGCFREPQGRLRVMATFLAEVKIVSRMETGQAEVVRSAGQSTRSRT